LTSFPLELEREGFCVYVPDTTRYPDIIFAKWLQVNTCMIQKEKITADETIFNRTIFPRPSGDQSKCVNDETYTRSSNLITERRFFN
jgi:hypothetical protein